MKYILNSANHSGIWDVYEIIEVFLNKTSKTINFKLQKISVNANGIPETTITQDSIIDVQEMIVDPSWDESSTPIAKPVGFDFSDPTTWETLSWDDIPKALNSEKLYVTNIIKNYPDIEHGILIRMIDSGKIVSGGSFV